jgi:hypothetical protein
VANGIDECRHPTFTAALPELVDAKAATCSHRRGHSSMASVARKAGPM